MSGAGSAQQGLMVASAFLAGGGILLRLVLQGHGRAPGLALLLAGWLGMLVAVAPDVIWQHPLVATLAAIGAATLAACAAWLLRGRTGWLALAGAAVLPLRVPVPVGEETYNLLLPLYAVLGVAAGQLLVRGFRAVPADSQPRGVTGEYARLVDVAVAVVAAFTCASLAWSIDRPAGAIQLAMFIVPFTIAYIVVREWGEDGLSIRGPAAAFVAVMAVAATIGIIQHVTGVVWQNDKVAIANEYAPNFRTNSIFWDPNVYGRYLVLALAAAVVCFLGGRLPEGRRSRRAAVVLLGGLSTLLVLALWYTYSQSSMLALAASALAIAVLLFGRRVRAAAVVVLALCVLAVPLLLASQQSGPDTGGRASVIRSGLVVAAYDPVAGVGVGGFQKGLVSLAEDRGERVPKLRASHTTPVTVLVEQGVLGVAAYALLLGALLVTAAAAVPPSTRDRLTLEHAAGRWAAAALAALFVHSLFYAAFFEDPATWVAMALLAASAPLVSASSARNQASKSAPATGRPTRSAQRAREGTPPRR